ncbi:MAG: hypothetical protein QNJ30_24900 [Kiloniellales bacterium]|nr:hypothetical protein [Kiloniellales bacterium]
MATSDSPEATDELFALGTLVSDLKRLESKMMSQGFLIAATLIGAAAEAVTDEMTDNLRASAGELTEDRAQRGRHLAPLDASGPERIQ